MQRILQPGRNCWEVTRADRVAPLVDGANYYPAFAAACAQAQRSILIAGWDLHSRVHLHRPAPDGDGPNALGPFLNHLVTRNRRLHVHILEWDFALIYALDREVFPTLRLKWETKRRVHFRLDGDHPVGASHHRKIVVVDDRLAFVGGLDITAHRWDTREHLEYDERRTDPWGKQYGPFHDVQLMVQGEPAAKLGGLFRDRWRHVTGKTLAPPDAAGDVWPRHVPPALEDVLVAIARTEPAWDDRPEIREVERLYTDAVRAARRSIYIENQYLTSTAFGEALVERLEAPDGPEIVIVNRYDCGGWLQETSMGVMRARLLRKLRAADKHDRLRVYYPVTAESQQPIQVHAKVMIVDDRLLRIGSSNLNNRSMGLDTECDLAIEADGDERVEHMIRRFRSDLIAEHLAAEPLQVEQAVRETGSLIRTVESFRREGRTLLPLDGDTEEWLEAIVPETDLLDPERPVNPEALLDHLFPEETADEGGRPLTRGMLAAMAALCVAAAWRWTPLQEWAAPQQLAALAEPLRAAPWGPVVGTIVFAVAGLVMVPVTVLIVATGLIFGPWLGFGCAVSGALASASLGYVLGRVLWHDAVRRLGGQRLNRLSQALARRGLTAVALVRLVPIAPFTVVNLVAGSSHIRFRDFLFGTALAMVPGILGLTVFVDQAVRAAQEPGWATVLIAVGILALALGAIRVLRHWLRTAQKASD